MRPLLRDSHSDPGTRRLPRCRGGRSARNHEADGAPRLALEATEEARTSGQAIKAVNKANGNPATRHVHPKTGQSVVIDEVTGKVIHVGGPGFKYGPHSGDLP